MLTPELRTRLLTGLIATLALVLLVAAAANSCVGVQIAMLFVTALLCIASIECARMRAEGQSMYLGEFALLSWPLVCMVVVSWMADCTPTRFPRVAASYMVLQSVGAIAVFYYVHLRSRKSLDVATHTLAELSVGYWLISVGGGAMLALLAHSYGATVLGWMVAVVALNDVGAYFTGRAIGGAKFSPHLSPNKTVSGSVGGYIAGILGAVAGAALLPPDCTLWQTILFALLVITAAQMGDLAKSYLKRKHGKKDTGTILPGHGGIFDRMDGHLAAAPLVLAWMVHATS